MGTRLPGRHVGKTRKVNLREILEMTTKNSVNLVPAARMKRAQKATALDIKPEGRKNRQN